MVCIAYAALLLFKQEAGLHALKIAGTVLGRIVPILAVVICFSALLQYFVGPERLARHLGDESGARGWFWALVAGVISHGPMYAWYPLLEDLRTRGMRDGLLTAFFYARAIKVPFLPLMIGYFGWAFTLLLSLYILLGALIQGWIVQWIERHTPAP